MNHYLQQCLHSDKSQHGAVMCVIDKYIAYSLCRPTVEAWLLGYSRNTALDCDNKLVITVINKSSLLLTVIVQQSELCTLIIALVSL